jgi:hypothetical protein
VLVAFLASFSSMLPILLLTVLMLEGPGLGDGVFPTGLLPAVGVRTVAIVGVRPIFTLSSFTLNTLSHTLLPTYAVLLDCPVKGGQSSLVLLFFKVVCFLDKLKQFVEGSVYSILDVDSKVSRLF